MKGNRAKYGEKKMFNNNEGYKVYLYTLLKITSNNNQQLNWKKQKAKCHEHFILFYNNESQYTLEYESKSVGNFV